MSSKEAKNTKDKLKQNQENFKKLQNNVEDLKANLKKKLLKEINALDAQQQKDAARIMARKRALALKGKIQGAYTQDEEKEAIDVPVDGQVKQGTMVYMKNCSTCHSLDGVDPRPMKGPPLGLIYNRRAGAHLNYHQYSDNMLKSTLFWTPLNLYKFMADPTSLVPKTTCGLKKHPLRSQQERADLITLFRQFTIEMKFNIRLKEIQRLGYTAYQTQLHTEQEEMKRGDQRDQREKRMDAKI